MPLIKAALGSKLPICYFSLAGLVCLAERMAPKKARKSSGSAALAHEVWSDEDWEVDSLPAAEGGSDLDELELEEDEDPQGGEAEEELLAFLLERQRVGKMSAKDICTISYWCGRAGLQEVGKLGMRPETSSGNFKRKVDGILKKRLGSPGKKNGYLVPMPSFIRASGERGVHDLFCRPPHELVLEEVGQLDVAMALDDWKPPPNYYEHPVVQAMNIKGKLVIPLALYLDGVQYGIRDSMLVVTVTNLLTLKKHVVLVIRKRIMCGVKAGCGCRGWCSLFPVWAFLRWSFQALTQAKHPVGRHNTELDADSLNAAEWRPEDAARQALAGEDMPVAAAVLQVRADWGEMTSHLGVANWSTQSDPCFLCRCDKDAMLDRDLLKARAPLAWELRTFRDYQDACLQCEIDVDTSVLSDQEWDDFVKCLMPDTRKEVTLGRSLTRAWPKLGLKKGDRVEPSLGLLDWQTLDKRKPASIRFWRRSKETSVRHRNPFFDDMLGTSLDQVYSADTMHSWCLGIQQQFVSACLWKVIEGNVFTVERRPGTTGQEDIHKRVMQKLSSHLAAWYRQFAIDSPSVVMTRVHDLTLEDIGGTSSTPLLRCKAHETLGLVRYLTSSLPGWAQNIENGPVWRKGSKALLKLWTLIEQSPAVVPADTQEARVDQTEIKKKGFWRTQGRCIDYIYTIVFDGGRVDVFW